MRNRQATAVRVNLLHSNQHRLDPSSPRRQAPPPDRSARMTPALKAARQVSLETLSRQMLDGLSFTMRMRLDQEPTRLSGHDAISRGIRPRSVGANTLVAPKSWTASA